MMEFVSWDDEIPDIWKKTCSKPPSRNDFSIKDDEADTTDDLTHIASHLC